MSVALLDAEIQRLQREIGRLGGRYLEGVKDISEDEQDVEELLTSIENQLEPLDLKALRESWEKLQSVKINVYNNDRNELYITPDVEEIFNDWIAELKFNLKMRIRNLVTPTELTGYRNFSHWFRIHFRNKLPWVSDKPDDDVSDGPD